MNPHKIFHTVTCSGVRLGNTLKECSLSSESDEFKSAQSCLINALKTANESIDKLLPTFYNTYYPDQTGNNKNKDKYDPGVDRLNKDALSVNLLNALPSFPENVIYEADFVHALYNFLWSILRNYGLYTYNVEPFVDDMITIVNKKTSKGYMSRNCGSTKAIFDRNIDTTWYTCGRAMVVNLSEEKTPRILIINTKSVYEADIDIDYALDVMDTSLSSSLPKSLKNTYKFLKSLR